MRPDVEERLELTLARAGFPEDVAVVLRRT
jgi:hypothetical protein